LAVGEGPHFHGELLVRFLDVGFKGLAIGILDTGQGLCGRVSLLEEVDILVSLHFLALDRPGGVIDRAHLRGGARPVMESVFVGEGIPQRLLQVPILELQLVLLLEVAG